MNHWRSVLFLCVVFVLGVGAVSAQDDTCPVLAQNALAAADESCTATSRNQACYGNVMLTALPQPGVTSLAMDKVGDIANVSDIQTLNLSQMNVDTGEWGVALMRIQANLPDTLPGQNVTFLLFGNVEITNAVDPAEVPPTLQVTVSGSANLRSGPSTNSGVVGSLAAGDVVTADGRLADNSWLRLQLPDDGGTAWVSASLVSAEGDLESLDVADPADVGSASAYKPMQAFYFRTGVGDSPCVEAPDSGILIQTPKGAGRIDLVVNEAKLQLGSTAYIQAQPGDMMDINLLEGSGIIEADGVTQIIPAGTVVSVPIDEDLVVSGPPGDPQPYDEAVLAALPVANLDEEIVITPPLTLEEIDNLTSLRPIPGTWIVTTRGAAVSGDCGGLTGDMIPTTSTTFDMPADVDFGDAMRAANPDMPSEMVFDNPQPGLYTMDMAVDGGSVHSEIRVITPTSVEGATTVTTDGCIITMPFTMVPA